jgi:hypothetical protein
MKPGRVSRFFPGFGFGSGRMPVGTVKKNVLNRLFSTGADKEKWGYPSPKDARSKCPFNLYNSDGPLRKWPFLSYIFVRIFFVLITLFRTILGGSLP